MFTLNLATNPTPEQERWLSEQIKKADLVRVAERVNPCIALFGKGPDGTLCKTCAHLFYFSRSHRYYKCKLRNVTHGAKTDHLVRWPACAKYQPR